MFKSILDFFRYGSRTRGDDGTATGRQAVDAVDAMAAIARPPTGEGPDNTPLGGGMPPRTSSAPKSVCVSSLLGGPRSLLLGAASVRAEAWRHRTDTLGSWVTARMGDGRVAWVRCERFMWRQRLHDAVCLRARLASRGAVLRVFIVLCFSYVQVL